MQIVQLSVSTKMEAIKTMASALGEEYIARKVVETFEGTICDFVGQSMFSVARGAKIPDSIKNNIEHALASIDVVMEKLSDKTNIFWRRDILPDQYFVGRQPSESRFVSVKNRQLLLSNKPGDGGLWTSPQNIDTGNPEWVEWCISNDFRIPEDNDWNIWKLQLKPKLNIIKLDTLFDVHTLYARFGGFDFEAMIASGIDGIWATEEAVSEVDSVDFYGWDVESILWLTYPVASVASVEKVPFKST